MSLAVSWSDPELRKFRGSRTADSIHLPEFLYIASNMEQWADAWL
eukprot:CAMPEP_0171231710 /NCGR_PEP_ID=MMETSP0790-20130122/40038_1 /TAXON_ID=2925 /ORGANISM="Alexandrium catenella, Strain OF101" /LENGTH=44 /DNA_ID= /DNA_START= /DNA_END= /DNA_ORIENTATION=